MKITRPMQFALHPRVPGWRWRMSSRPGPGDGLGDGFWIVGRDRILHWVGELEVERVHQPTKRRSCPHCGTDIGPRAAACDSCRIKQRRAAA